MSHDVGTLGEDDRRSKRRSPEDVRDGRSIRAATEFARHVALFAVDVRHSGEQAQANLVRRTHVVHHFGHAVGKTERRSCRRCSDGRPLEVTLSSRHEPRATRTRSPDRAFADHRRVGTANRTPQLESVARSISEPDLELGPEPVADAARVRTNSQRRVLDDVTREHRHRPGCATPVDRVLQPRCRHTVDDDRGVPEGAPSDSEFAAEVIGDGHAGKRLNIADGIVSKSAARYEFAARERDVGRHTASAPIRARPVHGDVFAERARVRRQTQRNGDLRSRGSRARRG